TRLEEDGEAEVDGLEWGILLLVGEEEVLGLEVPVDHAVAVAELHDLDDGARDRRRRALRVVAPGDDAVEQLPSLAQLHDEVHGAVVLARLPQRHDAGAPGQVPHDGHLPPHVLHVHGRPQLPLRDRLAREELPRAPVHAQVRHPELAAPQLPVQRVLLLDPAVHLAPFLPEHRQPLLLPASPSSTTTSASPVPRLVRLLLPASGRGG
ncbi:Os05g0467150, partial [Oryza sativa Japonica Group]